MVRLAMLLVDDVTTAEDVVQDAFAGVVKAWDRLETEAAMRAYLRTCVVNTARSVLRRRRTARSYVPPLSPTAPGADEAAVLSEEHREVIKALGRLPQRQREILVLRYWSSLSGGRGRRDPRHLPRHGQVEQQPRPRGAALRAGGETS